ncbi:bifunctional diaminohydroxyphosphoribosylaminopyrimidine deaminase/5-amino-6-(5-phosphoribosylamino)uracil reductase RibD, partial [Sutterella parvirubra]
MTDAEQEIDASRPVFSAEDERAMRRALELARLARPISPPNPSVGCVIMRAGEVLGEGFTQETGGPHAEVCAMRDAIARGHTLEGATAYVTLEPCSHYGRTPPCALALINAGFVRVVAAVLDPNPQVAGRGLRMLRDAGIKAECGLLEAEARAENAGFLTRMTRGTPWVRMKAAATLDG